jgi:hypothetical protein
MEGSLPLHWDWQSNSFSGFPPSLRRSERMGIETILRGGFAPRSFREHLFALYAAVGNTYSNCSCKEAFFASFELARGSI